MFKALKYCQEWYNYNQNFKGETSWNSFKKTKNNQKWIKQKSQTQTSKDEQKHTTHFSTITFYNNPTVLLQISQPDTTALKTLW